MEPETAERHKNWAGNYEFSAQRWHMPKSVEEVQELVVKCKKLKVQGTRHSFNGIADCDEDIISLEHFNRVLSIDPKQSTVTVEAGIKYGELATYLHRHNYGLHNLASLPHVSVAGAVATATHGSGDGNGNLATAVRGIEMVNGLGEVVVLSREKNGEEFEGVVVALGALGVVTKVTLQIVPAFEIQQEVYESIPLATLEEQFDGIFSNAYSVSLFTTWKSSTINQMWMKRKVEKGAPCVKPEKELFGATLATTDLHPIPGISPIHCTEQRGVPGPWYDRLPHFRMDFTPSSGEELQAEYLVPRHHAVAALKCLDSMREHIAPLLQISELRTIAADTLWMSPCYQQPCLGIHFTLTADWAAVSQLLPMLDTALAPFDARPHWGKVTTMPPLRVQSLYKKLPDFKQLAQTFDPHGKFPNAYLDAFIFQGLTKEL